jgi:hypothetical protein
MAAVGAALAVATGGCGSSGGLAPAGNSGGSTTAATSSPALSLSAPTAPPVTNPLSVQKFLKHPCDLLTKSQAKALGVTKPGKPDNVGDPQSSGPICYWHNTDTLTGFAVSIIPDDTNGLSDIYRGNQDPDYNAYFVPTAINGYPGVFESETDDRDDGACSIAFGVNDHLVLDAHYSGNKESKEPCGKVKKVAAAVITTIRESS